jgi:hypothetical protein
MLRMSERASQNANLQRADTTNPRAFPLSIAHTRWKKIPRHYIPDF